ncbi:CYTH domain-containing protein [Roseococcus sp. SYP-B2431]|uniref:CYTH domain-containing protein n=1 Tax=Roseococcus sp. SYP-B2431 TaxID=2496640 RepID=UPI00103E87A8|nr:CYTH domain-containing protein [Roseococcus sp. SYP-B2431]TCI00125.1 CYTH domain-containing protein [Roseococcus sp. SYP-B2431]
MPVEIERKFLVVGEGWRQAALGPPMPIRQGYVVDGAGAGMTVRVRRSGERAWLTLKSPGLLSRAEFEYPIPAADAEALLAGHCVSPPLAKHRTRVRHGGLVWEVDEFEGRLAGLVLAEVELSEAGQEVALPEWVGAEVTQDARFQNAALARADSVPVPQAR